MLSNLEENQIHNDSNWCNRFLVGVDGGGTSCKARVFNTAMEAIGEGVAGPANAFLEPIQVKHSVIEAVRSAALDAGITTDDFNRMHIGMGLAGADDEKSRQNLKAEIWPFASVTINSDAMAACLGAFEGRDGAIQILGTGSCGLLIKNGQLTKIGGHEFPISDLGGGAIIGLQAIQKTLLACDGVIESGELTDSIFQHFNHSIDEIVHWSKQARPSDYGWFAREVFDCADNQDSLAQRLVTQALLDVHNYIDALVNKGAMRVALIGSIAKRIKPKIQLKYPHLIVEPQQDPTYGAALMAQREFKFSD